jgi:RimJ/RimL family protein N-acetyltransferase
VPVTLAHIELLLSSRADLSRALGVKTLPDGWPQFAQAFAPPTADRPLPPPDWGNYFVIHRQAKALIGNGGFKGAPDEAGKVEIGYEVAPALRNLGYATEATRALIAFAFEHPDVHSVAAHTLAHASASTRVLEKAGMVWDGELPSKTLGSVWCWSIRRGPACR